jgi:hypothetical protein
MVESTLFLAMDAQIMAPRLPFWMVQRQIKQDVVTDTAVRLSAPNLPTCEVSVVPVTVGPGWRISVDKVTEGGREHLAHTEVKFDTSEAAWQAGYELYRQRVIV